MPDLMCYGLDVDEDTFTKISARNPIIFRIHSNCDKEAFVAAEFQGEKRGRIPPQKSVSRAQVIQHIVQWTTRRSPWLSCTFSLPYVLWEATRRLTASPELERNLYVSVIYAVHPSLEHRAILGVEALRGPVARSSAQALDRAVNFSRAFQEVLVYGEIPSDAVLVTLLWTEFRKTFLSTHLACLARNAFCRNSLRYYCERLREELLKEQVEKAQTESVQRAIVILGTLYAKIGCDRDLNRLTSIVVELSRTLFSWPYRHPSHRDTTNTAIDEAPVDDAFPNMRRTLTEIVERHPSHRNAALLLQLSALQRAIKELSDVEVHRDNTDSKIPSQHVSQSRLKRLRASLVKTIARIDALENSTASAEVSVEGLSQSLSRARLESEN